MAGNETILALGVDPSGARRGLEQFNKSLTETQQKVGQTTTKMESDFSALDKKVAGTAAKIEASASKIATALKEISTASMTFSGPAVGGVGGRGGAFTPQGPWSKWQAPFAKPVAPEMQGPPPPPPPPRTPTTGGGAPFYGPSGPWSKWESPFAKPVVAQVSALSQALTTVGGIGASAFNQIAKSVDYAIGRIFSFQGAIIAVAAVMSFKSAIDEFAEFDDTIRAAGAVAQGTKEEIALMRAEAEKLAKTGAYSAKEYGESLKNLAQSGFSAVEATQSLSTITNMARAGFMKMDDAARVAVNMTRAYGIAISDLEKVADVVVGVGARTDGTLEEMATAFKYVAPIAKGVGVEFQELVGVLGTLHQQGIKASMAGTAMRQVLDTLFNPTNEEVELLRKLQMRLGGVSLKIMDTSGKFVGFVDILKQLEKAGIRADEALALFGARGGPSFQALLNYGSGNVQMLIDAEKTMGGFTSKVASDLDRGIGGALRTLKRTWDEFKRDFGENIFTVDMAKGLTAFVKSVQDELKFLRDNGLFKDIGKSFLEGLKSFGMGMFTAFETLLPVFTVLYTLVSDLVKLFNSIPEWVREVGIVGVIFGGRWIRTTIMSLAVLFDTVKEFPQKLSDYIDSVGVNRIKEENQKERRYFTVSRMTGDTRSYEEFDQETGSVGINPRTGRYDSITRSGVPKTLSDVEANTYELMYGVAKEFTLMSTEVKTEIDAKGNVVKKEAGGVMEELKNNLSTIGDYFKGASERLGKNIDKHMGEGFGPAESKTPKEISWKQTPSPVMIERDFWKDIPTAMKSMSPQVKDRLKYLQDESWKIGMSDEQIDYRRFEEDLKMFPQKDQKVMVGETYNEQGDWVGTFKTLGELIRDHYQAWVLINKEHKQDIELAKEQIGYYDESVKLISSYGTEQGKRNQIENEYAAQVYRINEMKKLGFLSEEEHAKVMMDLGFDKAQKDVKARSYDYNGIEDVINKYGNRDDVMGMRSEGIAQKQLLVQKAFESGRLSIEAYTKAMRDLNHETLGTMNVMAQMESAILDGVKYTVTTTLDAFSSALAGIEGDLGDAAKAIEEYLKKLFWQAMLAMTFRAAITGAAQSDLWGMGSTWDKIGTSTIQGYTPQAPTPASRGVTPRTPGQFADGGYARAGQTYIVGERGPEMFIPDGADSVISNYYTQANTEFRQAPTTSAAGKAVPFLIGNSGTEIFTPQVSGTVITAEKTLEKLNSIPVDQTVFNSETSKEVAKPISVSSPSISVEAGKANTLSSSVLKDTTSSASKEVSKNLMSSTFKDTTKSSVATASKESSDSRVSNISKDVFKDSISETSKEVVVPIVTSTPSSFERNYTSSVSKEMLRPVTSSSISKETLKPITISTPVSSSFSVEEGGKDTTSSSVLKDYVSSTKEVAKPYTISVPTTSSLDSNYVSTISKEVAGPSSSTEVFKEVVKPVTLSTPASVESNFVSTASKETSKPIVLGDTSSFENSYTSKVSKEVVVPTTLHSTSKEVVTPFVLNTPSSFERDYATSTSKETVKPIVMPTVSSDYISSVSKEVVEPSISNVSSFKNDSISTVSKETVRPVISSVPSFENSYEATSSKETLRPVVVPVSSSKSDTLSTISRETMTPFVLNSPPSVERDYLTSSSKETVRPIALGSSITEVAKPSFSSMSSSVKDSTSSISKETVKPVILNALTSFEKNNSDTNMTSVSNKYLPMPKESMKSIASNVSSFEEGTSVVNNYPSVSKGSTKPVLAISKVSSFEDGDSISNSYPTISKNTLESVISNLFSSSASSTTSFIGDGGVSSAVSGGQGSVAARAKGGPVIKGTPYLIGERGPELFVPDASGTVIPNHKRDTFKEFLSSAKNPVEESSSLIDNSVLNQTSVANILGGTASVKDSGLLGIASDKKDANLLSGLAGTVASEKNDMGIVSNLIPGGVKDSPVAKLGGGLINTTNIMGDENSSFITGGLAGSLMPDNDSSSGFSEALSGGALIASLFGGGGLGLLLSGFSLFGRAKGGPVNKGAVYVVGEKGPELFAPEVSSTATPSYEKDSFKGLLNTKTSLVKNSTAIMNNSVVDQTLGDNISIANKGISSVVMGDKGSSPLTGLAGSVISGVQGGGMGLASSLVSSSVVDKSPLISMAPDVVQSGLAGSAISKVGSGGLAGGASDMASGGIAGSALASKGAGFAWMLSSLFPGRATGGSVSGGTTYLVGERGPELFVPSTSGTVVPNHALGKGSGGDTKVTVQVINNSKETATTQEEQGADGSKLIKVVIGAIASDIRKGGQSGAAIRDTFGLSRSFGKR